MKRAHAVSSVKIVTVVAAAAVTCTESYSSSYIAERWVHR